MGLQLVNVVLPTCDIIPDAPQYGSSLSDFVPGLRNANASDVAISTKRCPTAGGSQRLDFTVHSEKALFHSGNNLYSLLRNDLDFVLCRS